MKNSPLLPAQAAATILTLSKCQKKANRHVTVSAVVKQSSTFALTTSPGRCNDSHPVEVSKESQSARHGFRCCQAILYILIMSTYTYTRLTPETANIRLLTLLPGAFDDEIRITLDTALIIDRYNPAYEALSYTWGSADNPVNIVVGRSGDATFSVTEFLATALRYLRYEGRERVLFIEAVCVNQRDVQERRLLVERMAKIYGNARRVVIWLGPPGDDSTWGLLAIHEMTAHFDVNWETRTLQPRAYGQLVAHWADPAENPNYNDRGWTPILRLLQRPWFYCL